VVGGDRPRPRTRDPPRRLPDGISVGSAAGAAHGATYAPDHVWRFGLDRVLNGLAALVER